MRDLFQQLIDVFPRWLERDWARSRSEGRFNEAVDHLEAALERAPNAAQVRYSPGMAYRGQGRLEQARASRNVDWRPACRRSAGRFADHALRGERAEDARPASLRRRPVR